MLVFRRAAEEYAPPPAEVGEECERGRGGEQQSSNLSYEPVKGSATPVVAPGAGPDPGM